MGRSSPPEPLKELLTKLEADGHTGSLEVITNKGTGMILLVRGRFSNGYFETEAGVTFEKREALNKVYEMLEKPETSARVFQSEFSPDHWKARHETRRARQSRLHELLEQQHPRQAGDEPASGLAMRSPWSPSPSRPKAWIGNLFNRKCCTDIRENTPSLLAAFFFDMETEEIEMDAIVVPDETENRLIIDKLPAFVKYLENLAAMREDDHIEELSLSTQNFYLIVKCIPETGEGLVLITDKSQPVTLASSLLLNASHRYVLQLTGARV